MGGWRRGEVGGGVKGNLKISIRKLFWGLGRARRAAYSKARHPCGCRALVVQGASLGLGARSL